MTPVLSTSAWVLHDLGLATGFGGALFGKAALHPATKGITSDAERGAVTSSAWQRFSLLHGISLGTVALTWLVGRSMLNGRSIDRQTRDLVYVKDGLVGLASAAGLGSMAAGYAHSHEAPAERASVAAGFDDAAQSRARRLHKVSDVLGTISMAALAGVIGVTAVLAMKAGTSTKWSMVSRWLP